MKADLFTDGAARLNPGQAGIGALLRMPDGDVELARPIGTDSNNGAEYIALIEGLKLALDHKVTEIEVYIDSPVVAGHLKGTSQLRSKRLRPHFEEVRRLLGQFKSYNITKVGRSGTAAADRLANQGMDASTASMFTIHLDLPAKSASATCSKCLEQQSVMWSGNPPSPAPLLELWGWMTEHANYAH
jgi:ribonuclease HI